MFSLIPQLNLKIDFFFWITPSLDAVVLQIAEHSPVECGNVFKWYLTDTLLFDPKKTKKKKKKKKKWTDTLFK